MNIAKLKGKMAECGISVDALSSKTKIERSRLYRRFNNGEKFTVEEARLIKEVLELSNDDASVIFFG
jgi:AraC-like DNA-binding protein